MSKKNFSRKLSLSRETVRTLSGESLMEVAGGDIIRTNLWGGCGTASCASCVIYCGTLH